MGGMEVFLCVGGEGLFCQFTFSFGSCLLIQIPSVTRKHWEFGLWNLEFGIWISKV